MDFEPEISLTVLPIGLNISPQARTACWCLECGIDGLGQEAAQAIAVAGDATVGVVPESLSTLSPERCRSGPKTCYKASGAELPRWSFEPLEIMSFSCRTEIRSTSRSASKPRRLIINVDRLSSFLGTG